MHGNGPDHLGFYVGRAAPAAAPRASLSKRRLEIPSNSVYEAKAVRPPTPNSPPPPPLDDSWLSVSSSSSSSFGSGSSLGPPCSAPPLLLLGPPQKSSLVLTRVVSLPLPPPPRLLQTDGCRVTCAYHTELWRTSAGSEPDGSDGGGQGGVGLTQQKAVGLSCTEYVSVLQVIGVIAIDDSPSLLHRLTSACCRTRSLPESI